MNSIIPLIVESVLFMEHANHMRNNLKDRFMQEDKNHVAQLQEYITNIKQGNIIGYFIELRGLWTNVSMYMSNYLHMFDYAKFKKNQQLVTSKETKKQRNYF